MEKARKGVLEEDASARKRTSVRFEEASVCARARRERRVRARTRARSQHPTRATHARERKSRETGSSSPGKRAAVRGGNGSDGEERCGVWSLGPARHRGCHIDSRYRAESIATEPIPRDFQPAWFATFVRRAHAGNAEKQRSLLVAGEREGERVHACKKARNRDAERDEFANEAGRRLSPAPTVATRTLYNRRLPIFRARVIRMRDRR